MIRSFLILNAPDSLMLLKRGGCSVSGKLQQKGAGLDNDPKLVIATQRPPMSGGHLMKRGGYSWQRADPSEGIGRLIISRDQGAGVREGSRWMPRARSDHS